MKVLLALCLAGLATAAVDQGYSAPEQGYGPPSQGVQLNSVHSAAIEKTETVQTPSAQIEYQSAWTAPAYQRLVAQAQAAQAQQAQQGYAASETYGAPEQAQDEEAQLVQQGESKAFVNYQQDIQAGTGTVKTDAEGGVVEENYADTPSNYRYSYGVEDLASGDVKMVQEQRQGDQVQGSYSFMQPDGCQRTVYYMTDPEWLGTKAIVEYKGPGCAERYELPPAPVV